MKNSTTTRPRSNSLLRCALAALILGGSAHAQDYALELDSGAVLQFPHHPAMNTGDTVTIETWTRSLGTSTGGHFNPYVRYAGSAEHKQLLLGDDGEVIQFYTGSPWATSGPCYTSGPGVFPIDGAWHHLAFSRHADGAWETYVDGVVINSGSPGACCWLTCGIINATPSTHMVGRAGWQMLSLRVSTVDRYDGPFVPDHCWEADADTVMLLKLDEGVGATVVDASANTQIGTISGNYTWVPVVHTAATSYCSSGVSASGCSPALSTCGVASASNPAGFQVTATAVEGARNGVFLFGANGRQALPWGNGTSSLCVAPPARRAGVMLGTGTRDQCDGAFSLDLNAYWCPTCPQAAHNPGAGALVQAQLWYRDPKSTSNQTTSLSDAIEFSVLP